MRRHAAAYSALFAMLLRRFYGRRTMMFDSHCLMIFRAQQFFAATPDAAASYASMAV